MVRKAVISKVVEENAQVIEFPQNRTLYADQFTDIAPNTDELRVGFKATSLKAVFEHYKPCKEDIILSTKDGKEVEESFYFHEINDFDVESIIEHSTLLRSLKAMVDADCSDEDNVENILKGNLFRIQNAIHDLEVTYRALETFFINTKQENLEFLTLMNVNKNELSNLDSEDSLAVQDEISSMYERLSLNNNYSLLVLPGYLGSVEAIHQWAQFSYKNCVLIITDYKDFDNIEMLMKAIDDDTLHGTYPYLGNIAMTANSLMARRSQKAPVEYCGIRIPASSALAGRLANTEYFNISQAAVGIEYGKIEGVYGTHFKFSNNEIASLCDHCLIPVNEEDGIVTTMSNRTLYKGSLLALQNYAAIRIIDWIGKVFQSHFNDYSMEIWTPQLKSLITLDIHNFLNDYKGPGGIIEHFNNLSIDQDCKTKSIIVSVELTFPFINQPIVLEIIGENDWFMIEWKRNIFVS